MIDALRQIVGNSHVLTAPEDTKPYFTDWRRQYSARGECVVRPGTTAEYSLPFHRKRERIAAGAGVRTGAGGRAEVLWSDDASAVILFDKCALSIGDREVDEPIVRFHTVTRALLSLTPEDRVALPGGALLRGDPAEPTGLLLIEEAGGRVTDMFLGDGWLEGQSVIATNGSLHDALHAELAPVQPDPFIIRP